MVVRTRTLVYHGTVLLGAQLIALCWATDTLVPFLRQLVADHDALQSAIYPLGAVAESAAIAAQTVSSQLRIIRRL